MRYGAAAHAAAATAAADSGAPRFRDAPSITSPATEGMSNVARETADTASSSASANAAWSASGSTGRGRGSGDPSPPLRSGYQRGKSTPPRQQRACCCAYIAW